jgi:hypothetical protein
MAISCYSLKFYDSSHELKDCEIPIPSKNKQRALVAERFIFCLLWLDAVSWSW